MDREIYFTGYFEAFNRNEKLDNRKLENTDDSVSQNNIIPEKTNQTLHYNYINQKLLNQIQNNDQNNLQKKNLKIQITWKNITILLKENCCGIFNTNESKVELNNNLSPQLNQTSLNMNFKNLYTISSLQNSPNSPIGTEMLSPSKYNRRTNQNQNRISNLKQKKYILNSVSGTVLTGQFLTIIGASGAGKTTLLSYLSGKNL